MGARQSCARSRQSLSKEALFGMKGCEIWQCRLICPVGQIADERCLISSLNLLTHCSSCCFPNTGLEPPASRFAAWSEKLNTCSPARHSVQATPAASLNVPHGPIHPPNLRSQRSSHPLRHQGKAVHHKERSDATLSQIAKLARLRLARTAEAARSDIKPTQNANLKGRCWATTSSGQSDARQKAPVSGWLSRKGPTSMSEVAGETAGKKHPQKATQKRRTMA